MGVAGLMDPIRFCLGAEIVAGNDGGILENTVFVCFTIFLGKYWTNLGGLRKTQG